MDICTSFLWTILLNFGIAGFKIRLSWFSWVLFDILDRDLDLDPLLDWFPILKVFELGFSFSSLRSNSWIPSLLDLSGGSDFLLLLSLEDLLLISILAFDLLSRSLEVVLDIFLASTEAGLFFSIKTSLEESSTIALIETVTLPLINSQMLSAFSCCLKRIVPLWYRFTIERDSIDIKPDEDTWEKSWCLLRKLNKLSILRGNGVCCVSAGYRQMFQVNLDVERQASSWKFWYHCCHSSVIFDQCCFSKWIAFVQFLDFFLDDKWVTNLVIMISSPSASSLW